MFTNEQFVVSRLLKECFKDPEVGFWEVEPLDENEITPQVAQRLGMVKDIRDLEVRFLETLVANTSSGS